MPLSVVTGSNHPTIEFAACELKRYQMLMAGAIVPDPEEHADLPSCTIELGLFADLLPNHALSPSPLDDGIFIDISKGSGMIAGANARSCLLAVYRLLREAGCRFLRPGPDGERIAACDWRTLHVQLDDAPSYRHRGICIEGAVSREIFLGMIDWLPKNGMNAYFIQFREGFTFFDRWYSHAHNPYVPSEAKSIDEVRSIMAEGVAAIQLRGLVYHAVGHGWTCEPFGIPGLAWEPFTEVPEEASQFFAELDGKRELYQGIPLNTNLCYGNPEVRNRVVSAIADYAQEHPEVDLLHFWLADGVNNHCECALCRTTLPSDFYAAMLNQLDTVLTARDLPHRIVFLIYVDLLWSPEYETLHHPDRFVLMFAPITRTYSQAFTAEAEQSEEAPPTLPRYVRNQLRFPVTAAENLAFLEPWRVMARDAGEGYDVDSFDFDYHMMWDHYKDPGHEALAPVLHEDLANLTKLGLNGLISCQVQRIFFPSPLLMQVMAQTLWDRHVDYQNLADTVCQDAFGEDWLMVRRYLGRISELFHAPWLRREEPMVQDAQADRLRQIAPLVTEFTTVCARQKLTDPCLCKSWQLLDLFGDYVLLMTQFCLALATGKPDTAAHRLTRLKGWVFAHEPQLASVFDSEIMTSVLGGLLKPGKGLFA